MNEITNDEELELLNLIDKLVQHKKENQQK